MLKPQKGGRLALKLSVLAVASCYAGATLALPTAPVVASGQASFATSGKTLTVTNSPGAIINWGGFSIRADEIARFQQQSAASTVLNRVTGRDPSQILGQLQSNGRVFLLNPNGVVFGPGSRVDVAGLVVSTLNLSDADFISGRMRFADNGTAAGIVNQGEIRTQLGGQVFLLAPRVENQGLVTAPGGDVLLAAGRSVEISDLSNPSIRVEISAPAGEALNLGKLVAAGGRVNLAGAVVRNSGTVSADAVVSENGRIFFRRSGGAKDEKAGSVAIAASESLVLEAGSSVTADGPVAGEVRLESGGELAVQDDARISANGADGGVVDLRAPVGTLIASGVVEAKGAEGRGGTVKLTSAQVALAGRARIDASGATAGGTVLVGGDYQGGNLEVQNAQRTFVGSDVEIRADAIEQGDGGKVILWADGETRYYGSISARGGPAGGDGGFVEVSGKEYLSFKGSVDTRAPSGRTGTLLLDPADIVIQNGTGDGNDVDALNNSFAGNPSGVVGTVVAGDTTPTTLFESELEGIASATNVSLAATNSIRINNLADNVLNLARTGGASVTLTAGAGGISMNAGDTIQTGGGALNITTTGGAALGGLSTAGGAVTLDVGAASTVSGVIAGAGTSVTKQGAGTLTLSGANTYTGATNINAGTLVLGNNNRIADASAVTVAAGAVFELNTFSDTIGSLAGAGTVRKSGATVDTLTIGFNNASTVFSGVIENTGGGTLNLAKRGTGTLTLSGSNTYNGTTAVNAGTLRLAGGSAIPDTSAVSLANVAGATLDLNGSSETIGSLAGGGATGGNVTLGAGTLTTGGNGTSTTYSGVISGTGGLTKVGTGTMTLARANTYSGTTTVNAGTLNLGANNILANASSVVVDGGTFNINTRTDTVAGVQLISGSITGTTGVLTSTSSYDVQSGSVTARLAGAVGMNKTTAGMVTLSGANTYTGSTTVSAGTLLAANAAALGATAAGTSVASGATLEIANVAIGAEAVTLNGTGVGGNGALTGTGTASLAGNVTLASDGAIGAAPGDSLAVNGAFDGAFALAVLGGGQVTFGAAVGGGTALASLSGAAGTTLAINGGSVRTTGAQSYGGTVTTSGATTLTSTGAGNITANDAANDFSGNLALSTSGTASIVDSNTLALGASSVGTLTARTLSGDLTLNGAISATGAGESIVLVSAQDFVNNAGAGALTVPGAGRWLVYSTDPANDARGGLVYDFKHYGLSYTGPYGGPGTGNGFIYSGVTPTITPSLVGTTSKVYDGDTIATLAAGNYTTTGAIDGDTVTLDNPATGSYDTRNAGTGKTVSSTVAIASASNGAASVYGYTLSSTTASGAIGEITARPITVTAVTDIKTYDGATGSAGVPTITVGSLAPVGGDTAAFTQTFDNRNAGTNKVLTPTGAVTDGNGGNNYLVTFATDSTGVINQRAIMVTAATDTKTYDGTTSSAGVPTITVGSLAPVGGDTAAFTQTFDNRNAGTNKVLTPTGAVTDGNGGNNYLVSFATDNTGVITARAVTIASQPGQSKIYGNDDPVGAATAYALTAGSLVGGDGLAGSMGRVAGESLGNYNFTQGTASVSDGNGGNNYAITFDGATNPFQITARALTGTIANQAKVYGQNDPATGGIAVNLAGIVNRAVVDINGNNTLVNDTGLVSASLAGLARNPGESVGSYAITGGALNPLAGAAAGNYSASLSTAGNTLTVTQAPATASIANQNKVYGADDPALGAIGVTLGGLVNANVTDWNGNVTAINDAALTSAVTSLTRVAGENVGSYSMTAGSFTAPSGNYSAPALLGAPTLTIGAAPLAATIADQSKVYGSPDPAIPGIAVALSGLVNNPAIVTWNGGVAVNDTGLVSATLASLTRVAGETVAAPGPTYAITGGTLNPLAGAAAGNYTATLSTAGNTLTIAPAPLSIRADDASRPVNMANPPFTASYSGFQFADTPASLAGALTFSTTATISSPVGAYAVTPSGQSSPNYAITYVPGVLTVGTLTTNIDPLRNVHTLWTAPTAPAGASATTVAAPATGGYIYAAAGEEGSTEEFLALLPPTAAGPDDERAKPASFAGSCLSGSPFSVLRCTLREP